MNLFEIMRAAGDGNAFPAMAAQYGLSEDDVLKAVQAFLPAFSAGLKRSTADPLGVTEFMRRLASGEYLRAFQDPAWASGAGRQSGEEALSFLFGGPAAARALAEQAAAFTGIGQNKLAELFPALAATMFGGLTRHATATPVLDAMLKQFTAAAASTPAAKGPLDRYEEEQAAREGLPAGDFVRAQTELMQAGFTAFQAGAEAWQKAVGEAMKTGGGLSGDRAGGAIFGELFEPGLRLSESYQREMQAVLDRFAPKPKG